MKKFFFLLAVILTGLCANAQDFVSKVPSNASAVMKYSAGRLTQKVAISKMDSYEFIKTTLLKGIKTDSVNSLQQLGINFGKDIFQYATFRDSSSNLVTLLPLQNVAQFLKVFNPSSNEKETVNKSGYRFIQFSSNTYAGYTDSLAIVVVSSYTNPNSYYSQHYDTTVSALVDTVVSSTNMEGNMQMTPDTSALAPKIKAQAKTKPVLKKDVAKRPATKPKKPLKKVIKKPAPKKQEPEEGDSTAMTEEQEKQKEQDDKKQQEWYAQQDAWAASKQLSIADSIISTSFNGSVASINKDESFVTLIDKSADMSVWLNYDNLISQYWSFFMRKPGFPTGLPVPKDTSSGTKTGINIYFEKDKIRMEQKLFAGKDGKSFPAKAIYNSKQNSTFSNYVNQNNIGYFSMSVNTEAMERFYYDAMKKYLGNMPYISDYADMVDVYVDLLDIIIDEKAIADLMPGNFLFVMHDLSSKTVTYKDYEYDKDFNQKEVEKTKTELAPDFTFVMETRNEKFLQKLVNLPVKYAERGKFNYKKNGEYYELIFDSKKYPVDTLFFAVKNGRAVITTLKSSIDITLNNTSVNNPDAAAKNFILNNNYALRLNSKQMIDRIATEFNTDASKKIIEYLSKNIGDVTIESKLVDGTAVSSGTFNIKGEHSNSFEFFFNMIDSINDIIEKDKAEKQPVQ